MGYRTTPKDSFLIELREVAPEMELFSDNHSLQGVSKWIFFFFENATLAKLLNILARTDAF